MEINGVSLSQTKADTSLGHRAKGGSFPGRATVSRSRLLAHHFPVTCYLLPKRLLKSLIYLRISLP